MECLAELVLKNVANDRSLGSLITTGQRIHFPCYALWLE